MAGAFFAGAAFSAALVMGMADSHTMGSLLAAPGELWVHELEKPRVVCVGTGTRRTGLAKRAWRATASAGPGRVPPRPATGGVGR